MWADARRRGGEGAVLEVEVVVVVEAVVGVVRAFGRGLISCQGDRRLDIRAPRRSGLDIPAAHASASAGAEAALGEQVLVWCLVVTLVQPSTIGLSGARACRAGRPHARRPCEVCKGPTRLRRAWACLAAPCAAGVGAGGYRQRRHRLVPEREVGAWWSGRAAGHESS